MKSLWYDSGKFALWSGLDLATARIRAALMQPGYEPDRREATYPDISASECSGDGYTAGGPALTGQTLVLRDGMCVFSAADIVVPRCSIECGGVSLYAESDGTLIAYIAARRPDRSRDDDFVLRWRGEPVLTW